MTDRDIVKKEKKANVFVADMDDVVEYRRETDAKNDVPRFSPRRAVATTMKFEDV